MLFLLLYDTQRLVEIHVLSPLSPPLFRRRPVIPFAIQYVRGDQPQPSIDVPFGIVTVFTTRIGPFRAGNRGSLAMFTSLRVGM